MVPLIELLALWTVFISLIICRFLQLFCCLSRIVICQIESKTHDREDDTEIVETVYIMFAYDSDKQAACCKE